MCIAAYVDSTSDARNVGTPRLSMLSYNARRIFETTHHGRCLLMAAQGARTRYLQDNSKAADLYQQAQAVLPGGNTRQSVWVSPRPAYAVAGKGAYVTDADGETRIDFVNNYTSLIHGHGNQQIAAAVREQLTEGTAFGLPTPWEIELAQLLTARVDSVERVRFTNSGTEAVMMAIKVARAFTGRSRIAKFEGCYHGAYDAVEVSQAPNPDQWGPAHEPLSVPFYPGHPGVSDVTVLPFNDIENSVRLIERDARDLAAVVVDPVPQRAGLMPADPEFLKALRDITQKHGIVLIYDEVMSFRLGAGGVQSELGGSPDLTTIAKIIGGGFPVGAVGGRAEIMEFLSPTKQGPKLPHAGTFNGNPVTMIAGVTAMQMMTPTEYERIGRLGDRVRDESNLLFAERGADWQMNGFANMFRLHPNRRKLRNYRDSWRNEEETRRATRMHHELMARGTMLTPDGMGNVSTAMDDSSVDELLNAISESLDEASDLR
jgi:glutamate-1-semialdehyde 2,1-aminomutase